MRDCWNGDCIILMIGRDCCGLDYFVGVGLLYFGWVCGLGLFVWVLGVVVVWLCGVVIYCWFWCVVYDYVGYFLFWGFVWMVDVCDWLVGCCGVWVGVWCGVFWIFC